MSTGPLSRPCANFSRAPGEDEDDHDKREDKRESVCNGIIGPGQEIVHG
ncbi:MAG: hypothetical protein WC586_06065 [Methanoregula sp.]